MWRRAWHWLVDHLRTDDDDWEGVKVVSSPIERPGMDPVSVKARCPICKNGITRHRCWASEPEGDLLQCLKVQEHWWVRPSDTREKERQEGEQT